MSGVIELGPGDAPRWDRFVDAHPLGRIYHLSGWKTVLESCFGHIRGRFLAACDDRNGDIKTGLPLYLVRSRLTGTRLISAPFATLMDPLVAGPDDLGPLLDEARALSRRARAGYIEIRTLETGPWLAGRGFGESRYYLSHALDLGKPLDVLWRSFHRSCVRQRISRAESSGLEIRAGREEADLRAFHRVLTLTRRRRSLPAQPYRFIESLWNVFGPDGKLRLLLAEKDGRIAAGLVLLVYKDRVSAEILGSDDAFNSLSPVHGLFWHAIRWAHEQGYRTFDFGRTSPANASLLEFKRHWGTSVRELPHFFYPAGEALRAARLEKSWKYRLARFFSSERIPAPVSRWVGGFCYRHMG